MLEDNRRDRTNVDIFESTHTFYLFACMDFTLCILYIWYDKNTIALRDGYQVHVFFSQYWEKASLYVCLTRTERMNNRVVKYFNSPHGNRRESPSCTVKIDWNFHVSLSAVWVNDREWDKYRYVNFVSLFVLLIGHLPFIVPLSEIILLSFFCFCVNVMSEYGRHWYSQRYFFVLLLYRFQG